MKRYVGIFDVESFHKRGTDQKGIGNQHEETVTTILRRNGYQFTNPDVVGEIELHTTDSKAPDWREVYVVTVEQITLPENSGDNIRDFLEQVTREKREGHVVKPVVGRKFR